MKKGLVALGLTLCLWGSTPQLGLAATQVDALIEKLVEKGILDKGVRSTFSVFLPWQLSSN